MSINEPIRVKVDQVHISILLEISVLSVCIYYKSAICNIIDV